MINFILIEYAAKYLADLTLSTLPLGGVYLCSSVFNIGMKFAFEEASLREKFLEKFQNRGSFADLIKMIPVTLVLRSDLAILGCVSYALDILKLGII